MSIFEGVKIATVDQFNGTKPLVDATDITPGDALVSLNCKFAPGQCPMREAFGLAWAGSTTAQNIYSSPYYWAYGSSTGEATNYLSWLDLLDIEPFDAAIHTRLLDTDTTYVLKTGLSSGSTHGAFASNGKRLYASVTAGTAPLGGGYVWDGDLTHTMDDCFQRPLLTSEVTMALTQPAGGVCTAGVHYVGVLFQTRSGYWTRPGPINSSLVLQPQNITSTGTANVLVTLTPASTWPTWIKAVQVIYTTALNNFQYYVIPGTITQINAGSATVYTISVSVADIQIRAAGSQGAGTLADDYFSLLSMDSSNVAPFNVKFQISWGDRIVWFGNYGGVDVFFPSDPLNPEWITADQHLKQLPNGLPIGSAFVLGGVLYVISSAGGVFGYSDNGGRPVNFQPPRTVDSRISCQNLANVTVAASGGRAFVMADQGLFVYSGTTFPEVAMSYYQSPDLVAPLFSVAIKDLANEQTVILHDSTSGTGRLHTFNYQAGLTPDKVRASAWTMAGFLGERRPGIEVVRNPATDAWELWMSCSAGGILRQKSRKAGDVALYTDYVDGTTAYGIDWQYQTSLLPPNSAGEIWNHLAGRIRAKALQATVAVTTISKVAAAEVQTTVAHGLAVGTTLTVTISGATGTGWSAVNAMFTPTVLTPTTFTIPVASTLFGTLGGTIIVTINGKLSVRVKSYDDAISVTPATSPIAISSAPGRLYDFPYDMQNEGASYLFTNGALAGNGILISKLDHAYNLFAVER